MNATHQPFFERQWPWLLLALGTLAGALIPEALAPGYYHYDDNMHLFLPTFYEIGNQLRMGHMPWISDRSWLGGNLIGEGQFALFNPVSLALYAWMSTVPDTGMSALVFSTFHLLVLAVGAYLLVINLGGRAAWAAVAGIACANTSIVSYWYAAAWWNALVADAWLLVALAFWARYLLHGRGLLPGVLFGALSMVSGWPHGWIALGVFIALFALVAWRRGNSRQALFILGGGIATLLLALPAIAPVIDYALLSERRSRIANAGDMVGTIEMLLAMNWPGYLPQVNRIYGWIAEAPLSFAAWFVAPVLLACRQQLWQRRREPALALAIAAALTFFILSLGPEYFFFLRWPMRFVSYYQLALIVLVALLLSQEEARRSIAAARVPLAVYGMLMLYLSLSSDPGDMDRQLPLALAGVALLVGFPAIARRDGEADSAVFLACSTLLLLVLIHVQWPRHPNVPDWKGPARVATTRTPPAEPFAGNTILLHNWAESRVGNKGSHLIAALESDPTLPSGALALWSIPRTINGYSAVPHAGLKKTLCFNIWGHSCRKALESLFEVPVGLSLRRDELLNLTEIRIKRVRYAPTSVDWPEDWYLADTTESAYIYRRKAPRQRPPGSLAWIDAGLEVNAAGPAEMMAEALQVTNSANQPRQMIFSRLPYPGYAFALDAKPLPTEIVDNIFLAVSIPADATGRLALSYSPPLLPATGSLALAGLLLAGYLARRGPGKV